VSFVGTERGLEATVVPARGFGIDFVPSGQIRGKGFGALRGVASMLKGIFVAASVLRRRRPDFVIGVGGYASVPVALVAAVSGVPLFLQEQNAVPGRSNRILGRFARKVYAGFEGARSRFPSGRVEVTGNPVRREIVAAAAACGPPAPAPFTVLAIGGSQGARAINRLVLDMARLARRDGSSMRFLLQSGAREFDAVQAVIRDEGLPVEALPFTDRIDALFARCHAVLMRAGALSIAEAALFGKPCVLVPYPYAADGHQEKNAVEFCEAGAGRWLREDEATPGGLLAVFSGWEADPASASAAAAGARAFARPAAAETIMTAALLATAGRAEGPHV
ncbi:MAG TPA: UDP-N-acetylglucosamine--N-acetylmuramyl-(pentapeptide) pyrophosphoryl-undecaprenol N-acetylglucosamine transferase, partial [Candidatus Deferrimicrobiaceae bacterium]